MLKAKHIINELGQHPDGSFIDITEFNGMAMGACYITGTSPVWEMHPDTDEFFHVLDGCLSLLLLEEDTPKEYTVNEGSVFVVPKGIWHKPSAPTGVKFMYYTPGQSLHSDANDPRESE